MRPDIGGQKGSCFFVILAIHRYTEHEVIAVTGINDMTLVRILYNHCVLAELLHKIRNHTSRASYRSLLHERFVQPTPVAQKVEHLP